LFIQGFLDSVWKHGHARTLTWGGISEDKASLDDILQNGSLPFCPIPFGMSLCRLRSHACYLLIGKIIHPIGGKERLEIMQ
jgi:hypothetical protein